jgi:hypothetical protein
MGDMAAARARHVRRVADVRPDARRFLTLHREKRKRDRPNLVTLSR